MTNAIAIVPQEQSCVPAQRNLAPSDVVAQVALIQQVMTDVMSDGEHYGTIPGCGNKPTLLQPGAEKLAMTFRMAPDYEIERVEMEGGHREVIVTCRLASIESGQLLGTGVGSCSTMESKYRWRTGPVEPTGEMVPSEYWETRKTDPAGAQKLLGGPGRQAKKVDGSWQIVIAGDRVENPDIADVYNTVLKMAKKRAFVDAVKSTTAASDIFTQDIEDLPESAPAPEAAQVVLVDPETTSDILRHKDDLGVTDATFQAQLAYYGVSRVEALTAENAERLLVSYHAEAKRRAEAEKLAAEPEIEESPEPDFSDEEIPF